MHIMQFNKNKNISKDKAKTRKVIIKSNVFNLLASSGLMTMTP